MQLVRRFGRSFHFHALFCSLAVLVCELISRPYAEMGISDDGTYIRSAHRLATTGHILYNGVETPMLGWQLYLGAVFVKLFGFSYTAVRMSTLLVAVLMAFVLQRTLVRAGIHERNATIGTLALVLSPLYLMLSASYMTDIFGLFAVVICLYGCLRALQASTDRATIAWLCFAVAANDLFGTSRQIAWLGVLVMVPSTLWLLRARRHVFVAGVAATLAGAGFVLACMQWLKRQPYFLPEHVFNGSTPNLLTLRELTYLYLEVPFLLLPVVAMFLPEVRGCLRRYRPYLLVLFSLAFLCYLFLATYPSRYRSSIPLEPTYQFGGNWVGVHGVHEGMDLQGKPPRFLYPWMQVLITLASFGGLLGLIKSLVPPRTPLPGTSSSPSVANPLPMGLPTGARGGGPGEATHESCGDAIPLQQDRSISWGQLGILFAPFTILYTLLLVPRAAQWMIFDRYLLPLLIVALLCVVRYYQERMRPQLPIASVVLVAGVAIYGVACTHNMFAVYRARVALAKEVRAAGVPDTSVDYGFEQNFADELKVANHLNDERLVLPKDSYIRTPPLPAGSCPMYWYDDTPHIHPLYGVSFDPNACYGPAPFAPMHYSRWLASSPGTLYIVRYLPPAKS